MSPVKGVTRLQNPEHCVKCNLTFLGQQKHYITSREGKEHGPFCTECYAELSSLEKRKTEPKDDDLFSGDLFGGLE